MKKADWSEDTAKNKTFLIQQNLVGDLGEISLENFDKFTLQTQINKLAETRPKDTVLQMRAYLRDMFSEAVDQDFLSKDPFYQGEGACEVASNRHHDTYLGSAPCSAR